MTFPHDRRYSATPAEVSRLAARSANDGISRPRIVPMADADPLSFPLRSVSKWVSIERPQPVER